MTFFSVSGSDTGQIVLFI